MPTFSNPMKKADAEKRVKKAISSYRFLGREILLAELMNPHGRYSENGDYLFAIDRNGFMLAHPFNEWFSGKCFLDVRDSDGKSFIREIVTNALRNGSGFIDYRWHDPLSNEESLKTTYYEEVDGIILCSGFYHRGESRPEAATPSEEGYPEDFFELLRYLGA